MDAGYNNDNSTYAELTATSMEKSTVYAVLSASSGKPKTSSRISTGSSASSGKAKTTSRIVVFVVVAFVILLMLCAVLCGCIAFALAEISSLKSDTAHLEASFIQTQQSVEASFTQFNQTQQNLEASFTQFNQSQQNGNSPLPGVLPLNFITSCAALSPPSPSGYYWVSNADGFLVQVYCDTTKSAMCGTGGWVRVAELDMTNSSHQCPSGLKELDRSNIRTCVRSSDSPGCSSIMLPVNAIRFSEVCGRITAYQIGSTDAFRNGRSIEEVYVDGVSLTHGNPREHIWTFAAAANEANYCPCIRGNADTVPDFVGNDYFCETGNHNKVSRETFYAADPLWDGAGCES